MLFDLRGKETSVIAKTLDQLFQERFQRSPQTGEPDHPFYLAELRRFGAPDDKLSPARLTASNALLSFVRIKDQNGVIHYGGNQNWYNDGQPASAPSTVEALAGCGIVAALNILISSCFGNEAAAKTMGLHYYYDGTLHKDDILSLMRAAYRKCGSLELPFIAARYRKKPRNQPAHKLQSNHSVSPSLGTWGGRFVRGTLRLARSFGIHLGCSALFTQYCTYRQGLDFLQNALNKGRYVDIFTTFSAHPMLVYPNMSDPFSQKPRQYKNSLHHVVAVGLIDAQRSPKILISTWGQLGTIDYKALYDSWQTPKSIASALYCVYETGDPAETAAALRASYLTLIKSVARLFKRPPKDASSTKTPTYKAPRKK